MSNIIKQTLILSVLTIFLGCGNHVVHGTSNGSPVCTVGEAAVQSKHVKNSNNITGSIESGSYVVTIGNVTLNSTIVNTIAADTDMELLLSSVNYSQPFRGLLIVLNQPNVSMRTRLLVSPENTTEYKDQEACNGAKHSGITHTNSNFKYNATATVNLPFTNSSNQSIFLDVNIVVANNDTISIYYYTRFELMAMGGNTSSPTAAPTAAPTKNNRKPCGLFRFSIICFNGCGFFGRLFGGCK